MGAQFIHQNTYSMELTAGSKKENSNTVASVLGEGMRVVGNCPHVKKPQDPITIFGDMNNIVPACEKWLAETKDPTGKKMRKDANCLIGGVVSCSPEDAYKWADIRDESLKYLQKKFGDRLIAVIEHVDEPFDAQGEWYDGMTQNHMHYYVVPLPGEALENIHEGKKAVASVKKAWNERLKEYSENPELIPASLMGKLSEKIPSTKGGMGALAPKELLKTLKKVSNASEEMRAYKTAMRGFQSDYYFNVGMKMGLTRTGPKRMRLSRAENNARKEEARNNADIIIQVKELAYEEGKRVGLLNGYDEGFDEGKADGILEGKKIGYAEAFAQGLKAGEAQGFKAGMNKAKEELNKKPLGKMAHFAGVVAGTSKKVFIKNNTYVQELRTKSDETIKQLQDKLRKKVEELKELQSDSDARVTKLAHELQTVKANRKSLNAELDKANDNNEFMTLVIQWYEKKFGPPPPELKPKK